MFEEIGRSYVNGIGLDVGVQTTNDMSRSSILKNTNLAMEK
jgi:hypothetical protein